VEGRILIIEDHEGNRKLLEKQFAEKDIELAVAVTGEEGLTKAINFLPQVIVLSATLPDMPGVQVAKRLRTIKRTQHVHLMMLGDEENRRQRLVSLDAGANDFIVCPFDPEEVELRIGAALRRANTANQTDPTTGLPAGIFVQDQLRSLMKDPEGAWALLRFRIVNMEPFREVYGFMAGADLLRAIARVLAEALARDAVEEDFVGYGGRDDFIVVTRKDRADSLQKEVEQQFETEIGSHYGFFERQRGSIEFEGKEYPLAALRVRCITPTDGPFYDIRSLTEALAG
jgi:PleD family two-component response regulator